MDFQEIYCDPIDLLPLTEMATLLTTVTTILSKHNDDMEGELSVVDKKIEKIKASLNALSEIAQLVANSRTKYEQISEEIDRLEESILEINRKEIKMEVMENYRFILYQSMIEKYIELSEYMEQVIKVFEKGKNSILNNLKFKVKISISREKFFTYIAERLDKRFINEYEIKNRFEGVLEEIEDMMRSGPVSICSFEVLVNKYRIILFNLLRYLKSSVKISDIFDIFLGMELYQFWIDIFFYEKHLDDLSMGERAIVLLKVILSYDERTLIIDQPEEDLDNKYIYDELVPAFREAKKRRQIIICSHNANLVVNTDAEQIIT